MLYIGYCFFWNNSGRSYIYMIYCGQCHKYCSTAHLAVAYDVSRDFYRNSAKNC